jgi:hypothetical protein
MSGAQHAQDSPADPTWQVQVKEFEGQIISTSYADRCPVPNQAGRRQREQQPQGQRESQIEGTQPTTRSLFPWSRLAVKRSDF